MVARKRKKNSRLRGSHTHGWGEKKKHRGAGSRGGRGMAGTGKRGDAKKPSVWKNTRYFGKHGFKKKNIQEKIKTINLQELEEALASWTKQKHVDETGIDLGKLGHHKLLGKGKVTKKLNITVKYASAKAREKVEQAGGTLDVQKKEKGEA